MTCVCATAPSSMCPRMSATSNQASPRRVCDAFATAPVIASSMPLVDDPVISTVL